MITVQQVSEILKPITDTIPDTDETIKAIFSYNKACDDVNYYEQIASWDELKRIKWFIDFLMENGCGSMDYDDARKRGVIPLSPYAPALPIQDGFDGKSLFTYVQQVKMAVERHNLFKSHPEIYPSNEDKKYFKQVRYAVELYSTFKKDTEKGIIWDRCIR